MTNIKHLSQKIWGLAFAAILLTGITIFSTTTAEAQRRYGVYRRPIIIRPYRPYPRFGWYNYGFYDDYYWSNPYSQYVFDNSEDAAQSAYKQGVKTGSEDGRKHKSFNYERSHYFHDAGFGNFAEVYRRNFARGYEEGYREGSDS